MENIPRPRRRPRTAAARAVVAVSVVALGALVLVPAVHTAQAASSPVTLLYKTSTGATADEAEPWFELVNNTGSSIPYSELTIDYYFTADASVAYDFACAWAVVGCSNLSGTVSALSATTPTADHVLQISFTGTAGSLAPGANSGDMELRLYRSDWQNVNQANDYSFNGADTAYTAWSQVTVSENGALIWGTEPNGTTANPSGTASASASPTGSGGGTPPPSTGTMFDDFNYSSSSDPNLAAHDWTVRTTAGGPGVSGATWSAGAITFPASTAAGGSHVMDLTASTDGTAADTVQAEIDTTDRKFLNGTYAAEVYFNDAPTTGPNGDDVNETFYTISPLNECDDPNYSENDFEYLPNGGWGVNGPRMYTTTWYTYCNSPYSQDNSSTSVVESWQGWHTLVETVLNGTVTYYIDGNEYWSTSGKYYPREDMTIDFNEWFIDGYLNGSSTPRSWNELVGWVYYDNGQSLTTSQVEANVKSYQSSGTSFTDTVPSS
ncbi:MAG TPA: cellulose binding domain-containing protein [Actinocrinis sp.]|jgi:hypothetical protein